VLQGGDLLGERDIRGRVICRGRGVLQGGRWGDTEGGVGNLLEERAITR
jgi:hypothetical protein